MRQAVGVIAAGVVLAMVCGCRPALDQPAGPAAADEAAAVARLPVSLNALMVAMVNQAAMM